MLTGINGDINLLNNWVFRIRKPIVKTSNRVLLLFHGWSGNEDSMWVFTKDLPKDYWIISIRAPYSAGIKGYSWLELKPRNTTLLPEIEEFRPISEMVVKFLNDWAEIYSISLVNIDLMGFSQGAALVCALLLLTKTPIGKAACLAGFMPEGGVKYANSGQCSDTRIFIAHGTNDELIPFERSKEMASILQFAGAKVEKCIENVGHKLGRQCFIDLGLFYKE